MDPQPSPQTPPDFTTRWINLADARIGACVLSATDEFFAPGNRMLNPDPAVFIPGKYDNNGKWMDGWETRRKRVPGNDHCIIKLGLPGFIKGIDIDTSHFTGNYPPAASIEAANCDTEPDASTRWVRLTAPVSLRGNSHHFLEISDPHIWSHLRLNIYPDGGIARLRIYGQVACDWALRPQNQLYDLIAMENGGLAIACNDAHYGKPANLLAPGRGKDMGDGWETRRRREPGNDWAIIALGHPGIVRRIEVDTAHFKGNYPDKCAIQAAYIQGGTKQSIVAQSMFWPILLPEQSLNMDTIHSYTDEIMPLNAITHIRLNIIPDGGLSRLRLWGNVNPSASHDGG